MKKSSPLVSINIKKPILGFIEEDARQNTNITTIGVLIGYHQTKKETGELSIHIDNAISIEPSLRSIAAESYAVDDWNTTLEKLKHNIQDSSQEIIGWYHSHPRHGVFMSGVDFETHQKHFSKNWQVALVVEPIRNEFGFFAWSKNNEHILRVPEDQIKSTETKRDLSSRQTSVEKTSEFGSYLTLIAGLITVISLVFGITKDLDNEHSLSTILILFSVFLILFGTYLLFLTNREKEQRPLYIDRHNIRMVSVKKTTGKKRKRLLFGGWTNISLGALLLSLVLLGNLNSPILVAPTPTLTSTLTSTATSSPTPTSTLTPTTIPSPTNTYSMTPSKSPTKTPTIKTPTVTKTP